MGDLGEDVVRYLRSFLIIQKRVPYLVKFYSHAQEHDVVDVVDMTDAKRHEVYQIIRFHYMKVKFLFHYGLLLRSFILFRFL